MTTEQREYEPSQWERRLAAMTVGLIVLGILGIVITLLSAAFSWTGDYLTVVTMVVFLSLPLAIILLLIVVVVGISRRRRK